MYLCSVEGQNRRRVLRLFTPSHIIYMNTEILIFTNPDFGQIRTATDETGEPLFCLNDVCRALELEGKQVNRRLSDEVVSKHPITDSLGRTQLASFVNEDGLYDVILDSRKAEARRFRKWVTSVVLPQIRKTGGYLNVNDEDDGNTIMAKALIVAQKTIAQKDALLEAQKQKVRFAEAVTAQEDSILIRDLAKLITQNGIKIGQNRMFSWMRNKGYLFQDETRPVQKWVEAGLFDTSITLINTHHGTRERCTTKVTGKGQEYFVNGFLSGRFTVDDCLL